MRSADCRARQELFDRREPFDRCTNVGDVGLGRHQPRGEGRPGVGLPLPARARAEIVRFVTLR